MAITELYVDPSINADSGTGTIGDPYGDLEYAIEKTDWDGTNGIRVNIKAGTDEIVLDGLETAMSTLTAPKTVAWTPAYSGAPLIFQGYTAAAGDGGKGQIDATNVAGCLFVTTTQSNIHFVDLIIAHDSGAGASGIIRVSSSSSYSSVIRCELYGNTAGPGIYLGTQSLALGNYIHDCDVGINQTTGTSAYNIIYANTHATPAYGIQSQSGGVVYRNIIHIKGAGNGIQVGVGAVTENSIYSAGGTGTGIQAYSSGTNSQIDVVANNLIEGFSGVGGKAMDFSTGTGSGVKVLVGNSIYNCATALVAGDRPPIDTVTDSVGYETLTASPFVDAANLDFSPVDTGSVREGDLFYFWTI